ncbi:DNA helicase [[Clostridium] sordellii]|uniref:DNA 3'-5' helicase n=2 Tax=Paraclostridium sordellii TaxID=1505 RepID=A0ABM9RSE9_PARSO|nr:ATP-dependent helicase [Paeniclostridium sordellii]CEJ74994.1 putative DNA helicase, UvrD/REP type [[Clostridium] sordellii] [Paeniclostridium sordellii]CEN70762.1 DNA helicase [[Clostridium] sordellii] [Paeniclostridium sordellii]CEN74096.1 DNA helicase [[Clostridium] sordellii] [Paeniclostridium sordellii]CEO29925.1 DNA helicase [[Clostridium] sordellii] [Paeniclostridium sordellii]CEP65676.1 DNA helicase [[Clostridium] sordellii] [Paeniclostridium sordellii]
MIHINKLNENQKDAVLHINGPCMVLAGPGSGKTRVITYRILNLVLNNNINPKNILAISFTKASSMEMKNRALSLSNDRRLNSVNYGTFHSVFFRILRFFEKYELDCILDEKNKKFAIKGILKNLNVENAEDEDTILGVINEISYVKNELMDKIDFDSEILTSDEFCRVYNMYEEYKESIKKIDFDDMLIKTYNLLKQNKQILDRVRSVYRYILVDEFQDINKVQFEVIKLIASPNNNIFVVGDEDQSIYGFRGSRPDFLLEFEDYFKGSKKYVLDINYRSKKDITDIANKLIQNNENRYEKSIKCDREHKGIVKYINTEDAEEEAKFIAKDILSKCEDNCTNYDDFAVIYRTNIQSRALVDAFMDMHIPFVVRDSIVTIYDHWVARDLLAYLRLGIDTTLSEDWIRIINKPFRYISKDSIKLASEDRDFIGALINKANLHPKQVKTLNDLEIDLSYLKTLSPKNAISYIRTSLDYDRYVLDYCSNRKIKPTGLIEILNELESSSTHFKTINEYLEHIEKVKSEIIESRNNKNSEGVIFTTMHSAKGLEFPYVYIIGANEGTIPHEKSYDIEDDKKRKEAIEEERRLLYVGITRAQDELYISSPKNKYGRKVFQSRFIDEIKSPTKEDIKAIKIGDKIVHNKFGDGVIIGKDGKMIEVKFKRGVKDLDYSICFKNGIITKD